MPFLDSVRNEVLVRSHRRCCVCHEFAGLAANVHHIVPEAQGGSNDIDNAICLCYPCHAQAGHYNSAHPLGIKYSPQELRAQRDQWWELCNSAPSNADSVWANGSLHQNAPLQQVPYFNEADERLKAQSLLREMWPIFDAFRDYRGEYFPGRRISQAIHGLILRYAMLYGRPLPPQDPLRFYWAIFENKKNQILQVLSEIYTLLRKSNYSLKPYSMDTSGLHYKGGDILNDSDVKVLGRLKELLGIFLSLYSEFRELAK